MPQQCNKLGGNQAVKLIPKSPPGRPNRKLLAHLDEIKRLRTEGYSVAVIHQTLIEAGIQVGLSTVFLEVSKLKGPVPHPAPAVTGSVLPTSTTALPSTGDPIPPPETVQPVKKNALQNVDVDAFFDNPLNRNPLLKRLWKL